jgi:acetate kinase
VIRAGACRGLSHLGIAIDPEKNSRKSKKAFEIQKRGSAVKVLVIPTNEELEIAEQTVACIDSQRDCTV